MQAKSKKFIGSLLHQKESTIFLALIGLMMIIFFCAPKFLTTTNLYLVTRQVSFTAIVALGVYFVILTAGIDLSVGSVIGLSGVTCAMAMTSGIHPVLAVLIGLMTGALIGAINGAITAYVGVTPFIVTLGMLSMARGAVHALTKGESIRHIPDSFIHFGLSDVFGIPLVVVLLIVLSIISYIVVKYTVFGRRIMAVGGNEEAAELSGINIKTVKFFTYVICSAFASITGILFVARFRSAQANAGMGMELDAIAAAVIGGTSLFGGEGSVLGVLIGAMIMGVIRNGLVLMQVSSYWQKLIIGSIIVIAAIIDVMRKRKK